MRVQASKGVYNIGALECGHLLNMRTKLQISHRIPTIYYKFADVPRFSEIAPRNLSKSKMIHETHYSGPLVSGPMVDGID